MMELILLEQTGSSDQRYSGSLQSTSRPLNAVCKVMTAVCLLQLITSFVSEMYLHPSLPNAIYYIKKYKYRERDRYKN